MPRGTEGVAIVGHVPGPKTSSGYPKAKVVVRADRHGGVPLAVSDVAGEKSLSVTTIDWYQSSLTTASASTSGRVSNLLFFELFSV